jgi:prophage antirepressor-like protein
LQKNRLNLDDKYFENYSEISKNTKEIQNNTNVQPHLKMINESGLYLLLSKSNKKIAKQLAEKFFTEVLPELRNKGKFVLNTTDKADMIKLTKKLKLYQKEHQLSKKQSFTNNTNNGFIYVLKVNKIHDGKNTKCYKIGYTSNLEERMTTYRTGNPDIELVHHENIKCNKKQLEKCILSLNILKLLKNKAEIICNVSLKKIINEIKDCKKLISKYTN